MRRATMTDEEFSDEMRSRGLRLETLDARRWDEETKDVRISVTQWRWVGPWNSARLFPMPGVIATSVSDTPAPTEPTEWQCEYPCERKPCGFCSAVHDRLRGVGRG